MTAPPHPNRIHAERASPARRRFGFLTLPNYSMIALTSALETLRMANYTASADYSWTLVTPGERPVTASNGLSLAGGAPLAGLDNLDVLFVCGGVDVRQAVSRAVKDGLRRLARRGVALGALCTGSFALAEAGLLDGYRCAIHWENLAAVREEFPELDLVDDLYVIDRDRLTCTGGIAPLDMMLALIEARLGPDAGARVRQQFLAPSPRSAETPQVADPPNFSGPAHPALEHAGQIMRRHIAEPLSIAEVADRCGVSGRHLSRLFNDHLGQRPAETYLGLRLDRARELLRQSRLSVTEIALACGFQSPAHFSTRYAARFGRPPSAESVRPTPLQEPRT